MANSAAEIRREKLRNRTKQSVQTRDQKGLGRKSILDWSRFVGKRPIIYKEKAGKELNILDILPFVITQEWYKNLRTFSGLTTNLDIGDWDYKLELPVHRNVGDNNDILICNRLAFGGKCPDCEEMFAEYEKDEDKQDEKKIKNLQPSWRCWYNVYDYSEESNPDGENGTWDDVSYHLFEKEILKEADEGEETILFSDIEMGKTLKIKGKEKQLGKNKFIEAGSVEFEDREPYTEDIVNKTVSFDALVSLCTYEEFIAIRKGTNESDSEKKQDESETASPEKNDGQRRQRRIEPDKTTDNSQPWKEGDGCPHGLSFGKPDETAEECKKCDDTVFNACAAESDRQKAAEKEQEQKKTQEPSAGGRRRKRK